MACFAPEAASGQLALLRAYSATGQLTVPLAGLPPGHHVLLAQQPDAVRRCAFVVE